MTLSATSGPARLAPIPPGDVDSILSGARDGRPWAADYPSEGDTHVARELASGRWRLPTDDEPWGPWQVVDASSGLVVGGAGLHGPPDADGTVEIGYGIVESFRGRGIATDAVARVCALATSHGAHRVIAETDADNAASQRTLQRNGFLERDGDATSIWWSLDVDLLRGLAEVTAHGQPAHADAAGRLAQALRGPGATVDLEAAAVSLVDAVRNDPYLSR